MIVYELRTWCGEYWSRDGLTGTEVAPHTSAIGRIYRGGELPLLTAETLGGLTPSNPKLSIQGGWIYFQSRGPDGIRGIFRCRFDGTEVQNLTSGSHLSGDCFGLRISSDGSHLIYMCAKQDTCGTIFAELDGSNPQELAPEFSYYYMADLSRDNRWAVFTDARNGYRLVLKDLTKGTLKLMTPQLTDCLTPRFMPSNDAITFMRRGGALYYFSLRTGHCDQITSASGYDTFRVNSQDIHGSTDGFALCPRGGSVAYIAIVQGTPQLFVRSLNSVNAIQITAGANGCGRPCFSSDGDTLGFVSWSNSVANLHSYELATRYHRQITNHHGVVYWHDWGPD